MLEKDSIIFGGLALVLFSLLFICLCVHDNNSPKQVYKIEYIDINNKKQIVYSYNFDREDGSITYNEVNSSEPKTISGRFEIEPYKRLTYKEMEKYEFPKDE
ncbi:hypothetical protein [Bacillus paranthracis]|uniref:hypothetical protein n=1 Tax=Bacillus paranthracis TaxID=2026186 RepID=UPI002FDBD03D